MVHNLPEIVVYEHVNYSGAEWRINFITSNVGSFWNDKISSIIVISGTWEFFEHINYGGRVWVLTPGYYISVSNFGIPHDVISSFRVRSWSP
ncbi:MAG TPA: beta/gamma crystallin-related protein [Candidatus Nitrosocosmicus sp.]|nr:beta/gamma crystallin-related protein [Candidatus Nitrosocosmicus sp.]